MGKEQFLLKYRNFVIVLFLIAAMFDGMELPIYASDNEEMKQLEKYEKQLAESEEKANELKLQLIDPALVSDYEKLMELQNALDEQEHLQESLLERMLETETELEELEGVY